MLPHFLIYGNHKTGNGLALHETQDQVPAEMNGWRAFFSGRLEPGMHVELPLHPQREQSLKAKAVGWQIGPGSSAASSTDQLCGTGG